MKGIEWRYTIFIQTENEGLIIRDASSFVGCASMQQMTSININTQRTATKPTANTCILWPSRTLDKVKRKKNSIQK